MKLERCAWIFTSIVLEISLASAYYSKYYVEDRCVDGNETIVYDTAESGDAGILKATAHAPYAPDRHCALIIQPSPGQGVVLSVRKIDLRPKRNHFCTDYIQVFYSDPFGSPATLCRFRFDLQEETSYYSQSSMQIIYHTGPKGDLHYEEGFTLTFTAASEDLAVCKSDDKFMCDNGRCVWQALTCDGRNNCGDNSDESRALCDAVTFYDFRLVDIIYTTTFVLVIAMALTSVVMVCRYRRRRALSAPHPDDHAPAARHYQAVHPAGYFICQNPAGPDSLLPFGVALSEDGFANPCYPNGVPQQALCQCKS